MSCPASEVLAAWADGEVTERVQQALSEHVRQCRQCAARAEHLRVLSQQLSTLALAAPAPGFSTELAAKLEADSPRRVRMPVLWLASAVVAVAATFGLVFKATGPSTGWNARGGGATGSRLGCEVYVHSPGAKVARLRDGQAIALGAGYSFVVFNRSHERQELLLFAQDAAGELHWFYPAYVDRADNPRSIAIAAAPQVQALAEGITPDEPAPGPVRFVCMFSRSALYVHDAEALMQAGGVSALGRAHADADIQVLHAELRGEEPKP